jgi:hypothetical protein
MSIKTLIVATAALAATLGAGLAQAHGGGDVQWSVTIGAPVYATPYPVYRQPAPVYRSYSQPYQPGYGYREPTRWDRDGDGIPNRFDRVYNPRWDRDGDGVPNRYDRRDNRYDGNHRSWGR